MITVIAPAGYGKSTLLAQWVVNSRERAVWLSIDEADNDPVAFVDHLTTALDGPDGRSTFRRLVSATLPPATTVTQHLAPRLGADEPLIVVIDHLERLEHPDCLDAVVALAAHLPPRCRLAIASRTEPPLPIARLRVQGAVLEIGVDDLAMAAPDARALLDAEQIRLADADLATLVERTEGWPVGLYLAALALTARRPRLAGGEAFRGDDRLLADYVRSEVLAPLPADTISFLIRTSVLERMTGPSCDAVLDGHGSQQVLESLERRNLLLFPLDRNRETYRYHHLFRELLQGELVRAEPTLVAELHRRAATWFEAAGQLEVALGHAQDGGHADRAADLTAALAQVAYGGGRVTTVRRWLAWFEEHDLLERFPKVTVHGAWSEASLGMPAAAERWAAIAERSAEAAEPMMPDGSTLAGFLAVNRANMCARGVARMRADARSAADQLAPASPVRGIALMLEGVADYLDGDLDGADAVWVHASDVAADGGARVAMAVLHAMRGGVALERGDDAVHELATQAVAAIEFGRFDDDGHAAIVFAVAARAAVRRGDVVEARRLVARAARLRPLLTYAIPWTAVHLLQIGHANVELADPAGARAVLRDIRDILRLRPQLGTIAGQASALETRLETVRHGGAGVPSITAAELRLLPFLATHLSFREIGERVHVSRHTVKSQAIAVYRKLGVTSRSDAIARIQEIGLLGAADGPRSAGTITASGRGPASPRSPTT